MAQTSITSTAVIESGINQITESITKYRTAVNRISDLATEIDAMWDGEAGDKFVTIVRADAEKFTALETMLNQYVAGLTTIMNTYKTAEAQALEKLNTRSY